jgi:AcrR family transcriptional regulator
MGAEAVPRRKQRTDEAVLDEAAVVMAQLGPDFTLADVSRICGLSPATLVQRFGDKRGLVVRAAGRSNDRFMAALAEAPRAVGVDAVVDLFWTVTPSEREEASLAEQLHWLRDDLRDPELNALARERRERLCAAVMERLPPLPISRESAARLLEAQWRGALLQWGLEPKGALADYVADSLADWFALAAPVSSVRDGAGAS